MTEQKPEKLYRGIVLNLDELKKADIIGVDMHPPHEAKINEEGRKVVGDGNEYGVYMSDNSSMVFYAYSNPDRHGTNIGGKIRVGIYDLPIEIPCIGIAYEIDTDGIDIREPWITSVLAGHYNNGFEGKEWIADNIPGDKYHIIRARIGMDLLHDTEELDLEAGTNIKQALIEKVEDRKSRLEVFRDDISNLNISQRRNITRDKFEVLKLFYGENGARYLEESQMDLSTPESVMKKILKQSLLDNDGKLDMEMLDLYSRIWGEFKRTKDSQNVEMLRSKFKEAVEREETIKARFIERKREDGEEANTTIYDRRLKKLGNAVKTFDSRGNNEFGSLRDGAIQAGVEAGVGMESMFAAEKIIIPTKEENIKDV